MAFDSKSDLIQEAIRELARDYYKSNTPYAAGVAPTLKPVADSQGLNFQYVAVTDNGIAVTGPPVTLTNEAGTLPDLSIGLDRISFELEQLAIGVARISDSTADAFMDSQDRSAAEFFVQKLMNRAYLGHSLKTREALIAQLDNEVLDVTSEDFDSALKDMRVSILRRGDVRPDTILLSPDDVAELSKRDFVKSYSSISIDTTGGKARAGWANEEDVRAYFRAAHGLDLVVDSHGTGEDTAREFVWTGSGALVSARSPVPTANTFVQYSGEIAKFEVRRNANNARIGFSVAAEGIWLVHARNPQTGLVFSTDGSSLSS